MFHHVSPWKFEEKTRSTKWVLVNCCDLTEGTLAEQELYTVDVGVCDDP